MGSWNDSTRQNKDNTVGKLFKKLSLSIKRKIRVTGKETPKLKRSYENFIHNI